jgi:hypothetical protein
VLLFFSCFVFLRFLFFVFPRFSFPAFVFFCSERTDSGIGFEFGRAVVPGYLNRRGRRRASAHRCHDSDWIAADLEM